ncbi:MAG: phage tail protein, partial [Paracoccaceae bacterium]|nr:phage tail protein [Paracoccaceae bacterium]
IHSHFADVVNNPASTLYIGRMVDTDHLHVWGWDVRPYPFWPGNQTLWSDGAAYARGLWLNGRATNRSLASVVGEICQRSGVTSFDTSALFGVVRGYSVSDTGTGRAALQPLMLAYGFDAIERDGVLVFRSRDGQIDHHLTDADLARDPEEDRALTLSRAAAADIVGRVQLAHLDADGDYDPIAAEVVLPNDVQLSLTRSEVPVVLTRAEGQATVARWLQEAHVGRDTARLALPPSQLLVGAGDTVTLKTATHEGTYRIDRVEEAGLRLLDATRIEAEVYRIPPTRAEAAILKPFVGPIPVEMLFLDLPLLTGDELPHAPHVAASGRPWPGSVALYGAPQDSDYTLQEILAEPAAVGVTQSALHKGPVGIWDRQGALEVAFDNGVLSSASTEAILAGANTIAIGDGSVDHWEIFQFQSATALFERGFALQGLLRGQAGSRGVMPDVWPAGSRVVLLNGVPQQVILPTASRGTARHFRFGAAKQPITDPSYRYVSHAFAGIGLRPYPVAHLRTKDAGGDIAVSWIRCSRIDGDIWADGDIPLGEDTEAYQVRITQAGYIRREVT